MGKYELGTCYQPRSCKLETSSCSYCSPMHWGQFSVARQLSILIIQPGFGAGAIIAIYTQNSDRQVQSIAYSTDNGRTFTKYENNPVLTSEARDFRDPKVFLV